MDRLINFIKNNMCYHSNVTLRISLPDVVPVNNNNITTDVLPPLLGPQDKSLVRRSSNDLFLLMDKFRDVFRLVRQEQCPLKTILYDNSFINIDTIMYVEKEELRYVKLQEPNLELNIYTPTELGVDPNISEILTIIKYVREATDNENTFVKLNILMSPLQKTLIKIPRSNYITSIHVNTGSTLPGHFINLWRMEELPKVLIHELVHYFGIDMGWNSRGNRMIIKKLQDEYSVDGNILPNECYTECLALVMYLNYKSQKRRESFIDLLNMEINFSTFQVAKILDFIGADDFSELHKLSQRTSVFSYYILKTGILYEMDGFMDFLSNGLNFGDRYQEFYLLLKRGMNNKNYHNCLNRMKKVFQEVQDDFIKTTMRMTIYG